MFRKQIETETTIEATPEEVWRVLSDFASYGEWNPGMRSVQGEPVVGSRLTIEFSMNGGRTMKMRPKVLVSQPGHELRWLGHLLLPGIFDGEHRFEIHQQGPNGVRFVQGERFAGLLVPFLRSLLADTATTFVQVNDALSERVTALRGAAPA